MTNAWSASVVWVIAASLLGFGISAVFAGYMRLPRRTFLIFYLLLAGAFVWAFALSNLQDLAALLSRHWLWGVLAGVVASVPLIRSVRVQPASRQSTGAGLGFDIAWAGLAYGVMDALFLNVLPVLSVWNGFSQLGWATSWPGRIAVGALALLASLLVTAAYHVGYPEFRNPRVGLVLVGNGIITLAYLLSTCPLGAIISHTAMHLAAVLQGPETTIQLPPHYLAPQPATRGSHE